MHLVYVTSMLPYGPGEAFLIPEIDALIRQGHDVTVVPLYPRGPVMHEDAEGLLGSTEALPLFSVPILRSAIAAFARSPWAVLRALGLLARSRNLRVVAKNLAVSLKSLWLAHYLRARAVDHVHAHWAATTSTMALLAAEVSGVPWSFTAHRWDIQDDNLLDVKIPRACFARAISDDGARTLLARTPSADERVFVLHVGVVIPPDPAPPPAPTDRLSVLMAANFLAVKGHVYLLHAVRILADRDRDVRLDLAGGGPLEPLVRSKIENAGLVDRVSLLGRVSHRALLDELVAQRWDVVILPSIVTPSEEKEGIPVSLLEAMAAGVPVVSTRTGAIPELIDGSNGLLVPPADAESLADVLQRLLEDHELRRRLAENGRRHVREHFDVEQIADALSARLAACDRDR